MTSYPHSRPATVTPPWRSLAAPGSVPAFIVRRIGRLLVSFAVLVTAAFLMIRIVPGDPVRNALGIQASQSVVEARREALGLNLPLWDQYLGFWQGLFTGDLGTSFGSQLPVSQIIAQRLPATLELAGLAIVAVLVLAIPIGLAAAALTRGGRRRGLELGYTSVSGVLTALPEFIIGVGLIYLFAVQTQLLPVAGRSSPASYILPVAALALGNIAAMSRIVRAEALSVLDRDYIRTARSKRMPARRLYLRHALPNLVTSSMTIGGLIFGGLIAGTVLVENIFAWPGLGQVIVSSVQSNDFPLSQAIVVIYGSLVLLITLLVDVLLVVLDPRSTMREA